jgi:hypothetical protein
VLENNISIGVLFDDCLNSETLEDVTMVSVKFTAFWYVTLCSLVEMNSIKLCMGLLLERWELQDADLFEMPVNVYQTTWHHIPEGSYLHGQ